MPVSVETLKGLERKLTISVPSEKIEEEVNTRLRDLAHKAKVAGFRPGKVPMNIIRSRYYDSVRDEVAKDMVQPSLVDAFKAHNLNPASYPNVEPVTLEAGKDFEFTAVFEVFPEVKITELDQDEIILFEASVSDKDVKEMMEKLREQNKTWKEVSRKAAKDDKVVFDFKGFIDDVPFKGGEAEKYELILGSGSMIPGFEEGIIGGAIDKPFDIKVTFPKDYAQPDLAGKEARFSILIHQVFEGVLPELDEDFAKNMNIKDGGIEALKRDIEANMKRELERRLSGMNREKIFDKLMEKNTFDLPNALIEREIEDLKHEMYHRIFGAHHHDNEKIPDFPRALFEEQAARRIHLGLLFAEYVKIHDISATKERVDALLDKMSEAYEKPDELRQWYRSSKERLAEIEALVLEEIVADKISQSAKIKKKTQSYDEIMNPKKEDKESVKKGE